MLTKVNGCNKIPDLHLTKCCNKHDIHYLLHDVSKLKADWSMAPCIFFVKPKSRKKLWEKIARHLFAKLIAFWLYPLVLTFAAESKRRWRDAHKEYLTELIIRKQEK